MSYYHPVKYQIPFSLTELNERLSHCDRPEDLKHIKFMNLPPYSLKRLVDAILYPLECYEDFTQDRIDWLQRKIKQLFPVAHHTDVERDSRKLLLDRISLIQKFNPHKGCPFPGGLIDARVEEQRKLLESNPPQARLQKMIDLKSVKEKAARLQQILNLLVIEEETFAQYTPCLKQSLLIDDYEVQFNKGKRAYLRLQRYDELTTFEFPQEEWNIDEVLLWTKVVKSNPHIITVFGENSLSFYVHHLRERWSEESLNQLKYLKSKTKNEKLGFIIEKVFLQSRMIASFFEMKNNQEKFLTFRNKLSHFPEAVEVLAAPAYHLLVEVLSNRERAIQIPGGFPVSPMRLFSHYYKEGEKVANLWAAVRAMQKEFYRLAWRELDQIIHSADKRDKMAFFQYNKNISRLLGPGEKPGPLIDPYTEPRDPFQRKLLGLQVKNDPAEIALEWEMEVKQFIHSPAPEKPKAKKSKKGKEKSFAAAPKQPVVPSAVSVAVDAPAIAPQHKLLGSPPPFIFGDRVERWHRHPAGQPLPEEIFPEYAGRSAQYQTFMHALHAMPKQVHYFVNEFAKQGPWKNMKRGKIDLCHTMLAELKFQEETHRGHIIYCTDEAENICYHVMFKSQSRSEIFNTIFTSSYDFPDLQQPDYQGVEKFKPIEYHDEGIVVLEYDPQLGKAVIFDRRRDLTITLGKTK